MTITTQTPSTLDSRRAEAHAARVEWQRHLNGLAHRDGSWARLTSEEKQVLREAAMGAIPEAIMEASHTVWMPDGPVLVERGYWTAEVPLVVNRGDYGLLAPDCAEWREEPIGLADDSNVFLIDPTSDFTLHDGLTVAGPTPDGTAG
ncbi:hypothetical protein ASG90_02375 [Nocardioides sp. Soil797]|nr:hypothetical protein ASG90_02375 [Nocardioides sp. Soil797]